MNIADILDQHAEARPDAPALLRGDWQLSYAKTRVAVQRMAAVLAGRGVGASDLVGVSMREDPVLLLLSVLALARLGATGVPINPRTPRGRRKAIGEHFKLAATLTDRDDIRAASGRVIVAERAWRREAPKTAAPAHPGGEHPWSITLTSGTTGIPKGVARTHAEFFRLCALQGPLARLGRDSRFFCLMDLHNTAVIMRALNHLAYGGAVVFQNAPFPGGALPIDRHRVTHIFASPVVMQIWLRARPSGRPRFGTLQQLVVGGGPLSAALGRQVVERITPNLFLSYGTTETGVVALADPQTREQHPDTAGRLVPWIEAQVVDENGRPLPEGESGQLRFRGEGVAGGYYRHTPEPGSSAKAFRDGWFYPGDTARIDAGRLLYVEGRSDDIVNVGGPKFNATAIEAILARHPGVREAAVFSVQTPDGKTRLVAAVVARGSLDPAALVQHYRKQGGKLHRLLRVVQVPRLPRNAMGKVLKQELKRSIRFKRGAGRTG